MPGTSPEQGIRGMLATRGLPHPDGGIYKWWQDEWPHTPQPEEDDSEDPQPPAVELPPGMKPIPDAPPGQRRRPLFDDEPEPGLFRRDRDERTEPWLPEEETLVKRYGPVLRGLMG